MCIFRFWFSRGSITGHSFVFSPGGLSKWKMGPREVGGRGWGVGLGETGKHIECQNGVELLGDLGGSQRIVLLQRVYIYIYIYNIFIFQLV